MIRSFIFHGVLVIGFPLISLIYTWTGISAERDAKLKALQMAKTAIRVDVVDLPSMKLSELEKVDLSKEVDESDKAAEEAAKAAEKKASETAMLDRTRKAEEEKEKTKKEKEKEKELEKQKAAEAKDHKEAAQRIKDLQARLRNDQKRRDLIDKLKKKSGDGRVALGGNIKSEGYSLTGDLATAADAYTGKARAHVFHNWNVPPWMNSSNLSATILVKIGPDGRVLTKKFQKRSGNTEFDNYVERAIDLSDPLPAPPEELKNTFMEEGIVWGFPN